MIRLYFILAVRSLLRSKLFSAVNISGLAIGFSAFILITLYVRDELSYDDFHPKGDRIYRMWNQSNGRNLAITPPLWADYLKEELSQVENSVTLQPISTVVIKDNEPYAESKVFATGPSFLEIFDFEIISGTENSMLQGPTDLVISREMALKYFGREDPIGETLQLDLFGAQESFTVSGVLECPRNSHLQFDFLVPYELVKRNFHSPQFYDRWTVQFVYTYLLTKGEIDITELSLEFKEFLFRHGGQELKERFSPGVESLKSIYLQSDLVYDSPPRGSLSQLRILMIIAAAVLMIALINFVNLSTAQSLRRAKEVGLRKVFGSGRSSLIAQFLIESIFTSMLAMLMAVLIVLLILPGFNDFTERTFEYQTVFSPFFISIFFVVPLMTGILAGLYPAMVISGFQPLSVLRSRSANKAQGQLARQSLVIFQFSAAVILLVSTGVVRSQVDFMDEMDMGFSEEQVIAINDNGVVSASKLKRDRLRASLAGLNDVTGMSVSSSYPSDNTGSSRYIPEGYESNESIPVSTIFSDFDFVKTYQIQMVAGRELNESLTSDSSAFLINEAAQKLFAGKDTMWLQEPLGKYIDFPSIKKRGPVVGVFKDFNFQSLHTEIGPLIITLHPTRIAVTQIRMDTENLSETIAGVADIWKELFPETPFDYVFVDEAFARKYSAEKKLGQLFQVFSGLAIFIAILGLFSLASFMARERAREMSIRKVVGATQAQLLWLFAIKFNRLVLIGNVIGIPVSFWLMSNWLKGFAFRTEMPWSIFLGAFVLSMVMAAVATAYHTLKSTTQNPAIILAQE